MTSARGRRHSKTRAGYGFVCTFPRPEASVIPPQTPRRGRVLPGGGCPLGTPSPSRSCMLRRGRRCAVVASKRRPWGRCSAAGASGGAGARGCKVLQPVTRRAGRGGWSFNLFQNVSLCRPARAATLGRVARKAGLPLRRQALRALRERGVWSENRSVGIRFLFGFVRYCSGLFGQQLRSETYGGISEIF